MSPLWRIAELDFPHQWQLCNSLRKHTGKSIVLCCMCVWVWITAPCWSPSVCARRSREGLCSLTLPLLHAPLIWVNAHPASACCPSKHRGSDWWVFVCVCVSVSPPGQCDGYKRCPNKQLMSVCSDDEFMVPFNVINWKDSLFGRNRMT